ncbi:hypothetical protein CBP36_19510 (plasmid) [Acidovorax carolinensis]|uniref:Uncharacterized protein n=2 Tax=Acidovorax carolinensis TaxID=553814 RepID=A0A240UJ60_9BURK|nr:hypothetical protein CBP35_19460 [Acidovorax carolinensis]ART61156.1 hypothetical protein CBP36_19510 [Acidovorax carolinensis]
MRDFITSKEQGEIMRREMQPISVEIEVDDRPIPVRYYARGPEAEAEQLEVFCNDQGMVILKIDDDAFLEMAPAMAKRLREKLSVVIRESLADMLRPDSEA